MDNPDDFSPRREKLTEAEAEHRAAFVADGAQARWATLRLEKLANVKIPLS
jgi:hypothetical protein